MAWIKERKTNGGEIRFKAVIRLKGFPTQTATFRRKTDAKLWVQQTEAAIREGRHFKTTEGKRRTFADMVDRYIETVVPFRHQKPLAKNAICCHLGWWKEMLGPYALADITPAKIAELRDQLMVSPTSDSFGRPLTKEEGKARKTKSPSTVVRYLASLSVMYTTAINEWGWVEQNPAKKVKRPTEPRGRVRFLSDDERMALLEACKASENCYLYPIVVFALSTGARQGEVLSITWKQVDFERNVVRLENTKNNERRALPLVGYAYDLLKELYATRRSDTQLVFPRPDGKRHVSIVKKWKRAVAEAGLEDFKFHDLRHSAASYLAMNGATLAEIAEILGHKTLQMVKRYAHLSEQHTTNVVARMNDKIFK